MTSIIKIKDQVQKSFDSTENLAADSETFRELSKLHDEKPLLYAGIVIAMINSKVDELKKLFVGDVLRDELAKFYLKIRHLPHFDLFNGPEPHKQPEDQEVRFDNFDGILADIRGGLRRLSYASKTASPEKYQETKQELAKLIGRVRQSLTSDPIRLKEFNDKLRKLLDDGGFASGYRDAFSYTGTHTEQAKKAEFARIRAELESSGILDKLMPNDTRRVYIHRTSEDMAQKIMREGFVTTDNIGGTASAMLRDRDDVARSFIATHKSSTSVVVMYIPVEIADKIDDRGTLPREKMTNGRDTGVIPPSWILGYVDRDKVQLTENEHYQDTSYDKVKPAIDFSPRTV